MHDAGRMTTSLASVADIERSIHVVRGHRVILDADLARLYGVETKKLNQAVKRNLDRFPEDFMFRLSADEEELLRSQSVTSNPRGGRRYMPYGFTQEGVAMLSSVLNSKRAIAVNIEIMRTFVRMRRALAQNVELARRLDDLENNVGTRFAEHEKQLHLVFEAIRQLMVEEGGPEPASIGFQLHKHE